ncbi:MAG TPA: ThuA domain-containing protein [Candidatus Acidoferrum sp.]|nr:ThuA domain-containing protein [Candidatus Acidoferrum sp.]
MTHNSDRREFLRTLTTAAITATTAGLAFSHPSFSAPKKSLLVFTKSSGFEHEVVKRKDGKLSIAENVVTELGKKNGFEVNCSKDGRIFDSKDLHAHQAVFFFTTGDLTQVGTDANPAMSPAGKQTLLTSIEQGLGFVGCHAASDTFHTPPDPADLSNRYIAHGAQSDPYLRMLGGEFIVHGRDPRLQTANIIINDPSFPGLAGVQSPVSFNEEWYSLKDFAADIHVIATVDTNMLKNECYQRRPYPVVWARMNGKGRVFFTALGDRPENWQNPFHVNLLAGGILWSLGEAKADLSQNLLAAAPGYADIPPKFPPALGK